MKPFIDPSFWSDPDIEKQPAGVKLCALWLFTNSQTSLLGVCGASVSRFTFETGLPQKALERTLEALPKSLTKIGDSIFVRNYIRHQFGAGEKLTRNNFFVALSSLFLGIKDRALRSEILKEYPEFTEALSKGSEGLTKPQEGGKGKVREGKESPPYADRVGILVGRTKLFAEWSLKEQSAFRKLKINDDRLTMLERYYGSERKKKENICRRDLYTLLNNYSGEEDRALTWCELHPLPGSRKIVAAKEIEFRPVPHDPEATRKFLEDYERHHKRLPFGWTRNGSGEIHQVTAA